MAAVYDLSLPARTRPGRAKELRYEETICRSAYHRMTSDHCYCVYHWTLEGPPVESAATEMLFTVSVVPQKMKILGPDGRVKNHERVDDFAVRCHFSKGEPRTGNATYFLRKCPHYKGCELVTVTEEWVD